MLLVPVWYYLISTMDDIIQEVASARETERGTRHDDKRVKQPWKIEKAGIFLSET